MGRSLVFANSVSRTVEAHKLLSGADHGRGPLYLFHPEIPHKERERTLKRFGQSRGGILVCSGLAARGIDLPDVSLVIEYQTAPNLIEHVHRVGRTARAGREGKAVSIVSADRENEAELVKEIERCRKGGWKYV